MVMSLSPRSCSFPTAFGVHCSPARRVYCFGIVSAFSTPQAATGAKAHGNVDSDTDASSVK